jgi:hypothetical protein
MAMDRGRLPTSDSDSDFARKVIAMIHAYIVHLLFTGIDHPTPSRGPTASTAAHGGSTCRVPFIRSDFVRKNPHGAYQEEIRTRERLTCRVSFSRVGQIVQSFDKGRVTNPNKKRY